jgi:hypothetical protein
MVPANHEHLVVSGMVADESLQKSANLAESGALKICMQHNALRTYHYEDIDILHSTCL